MGNLAEVTLARSITVTEEESVHGLYRYLEEKFPDLKTTSFKIMVNNEVINTEQELKAGDEVLLVPPHQA